MARESAIFVHVNACHSRILYTPQSILWRPGPGDLMILRSSESYTSLNILYGHVATREGVETAHHYKHHDTKSQGININVRAPQKRTENITLPTLE